VKIIKQSTECITYAKHNAVEHDKIYDEGKCALVLSDGLVSSTWLSHFFSIGACARYTIL